MTDTKIGAKPTTLPDTWKESLYRSLHRSTLPLKAIADHLGLSRSMLDKVADETTTDNLSSRHLPALAAATSDLTWLDYLEAKAGRHAYRLPAATALISVETIATLKEFSEFLSSVADAVADGSVSPEDSLRIEREGLEAIASIQSVMAAARAQAQRGGAPARRTEDIERFGVARGGQS